MTRKTAKPRAAAAAPAPAKAAPVPADPPVRPSRLLRAGVSAFVIVFAAAGYAAFGNLEGWKAGPGAAQQQAGHDQVQFEAMAGKLAARLKERPDDADGWSLLARTYMATARFNDAVAAYRKLSELRPKDADVFADWADAQAMANGRKLDGEPEALIRKALQANPEHVKALALAGTVAYERGDLAGALAHWERAVRNAEPGSEMAQRLQGAVAEVRERTGQPPAPQKAAAPGGSVSGEVTLSDALRAGAAPDDVVYIFARPADSKMPLALVRKQVRDLPYRFTLDDSTAMNPALPLSSVKTVVVGARVTKTGQAVPQPGDLQGFSRPVTLGQANVKVEIGETVR
jgi:cytochrome c-type biogenesis protein CcmH